METYTIYRFRRLSNKKPQIIRTGLSLEQARDWCSKDDTRGDNWFDGFKKN